MQHGMNCRKEGREGEKVWRQQTFLSYSSPDYYMYKDLMCTQTLEYLTLTEKEANMQLSLSR